MKEAVMIKHLVVCSPTVRQTRLLQQLLTTTGWAVLIPSRIVFLPLFVNISLYFDFLVCGIERSVRRNGWYVHEICYSTGQQRSVHCDNICTTPPLKCFDICMRLVCAGGTCMTLEGRELYIHW